MGVSKNRGGPPKSSILIGFSLINHPFWGTPIFGNTHIIHIITQLAVWLAANIGSMIKSESQGVFFKTNDFESVFDSCCNNTWFENWKVEWFPLCFFVKAQRWIQVKPWSLWHLFQAQPTDVAKAQWNREKQVPKETCLQREFEQPIHKRFRHTLLKTYQ